MTEVSKDGGGVVIGQGDCAIRLETRSAVTDFVREILANAIELWPVYFVGTCSWFGGSSDEGVSPSEPLAFIYDYETHKHLFYEQQPSGTSGLARRLNCEEVPYVACRWDYEVTSKTMLADHDRYEAIVRNPKTGRSVRAFPADWGPHEEKTGRACDVSLAVMEQLEVETDDQLEVFYPAPRREGHLIED